MSTAPSPRKVACPGCSAVYTVPATMHVGKTRCKKCQTLFEFKEQGDQLRATVVKTEVRADAAKAPEAPRKTAAKRPVDPHAIASRPSSTAAPLRAGAVDAPPAAPKPPPRGGGVLGLIGLGAWLTWKATAGTARLSWWGTRKAYALSTGPNKKYHLPWITATAAACIAGLVYGGMAAMSWWDAQTAPSQGDAVAQAQPAATQDPIKPSAEKKPDDKPAADKKSDDKPVAEKKPDNKPVAEKKPDGKPAVEKKPDDKPAAEKKPDDKPVTEKKPDDVAIQRKPSDLVVKPRLGQRSVQFDVKMKFKTLSKEPDGAHTFGANFAAQILETTERIDQLQRNTFVKLKYEECKLKFSLDKEDDAVVILNQEEIAKHISKVVMRQKLDKENQQLDLELDLNEVPDEGDTQKAIASFHSNLNLMMGLLCVRMPGKDFVEPDESWSESHSVSMPGGGKSADTTTLATKCTYLGIRKRNGRDEAIISVKPTILSKKGDEVLLKGEGDGEAVLDLDAAQITSVQLNIKMDMDTSMVLIDGKERATGTLELSLRRNLPAAK